MSSSYEDLLKRLREKAKKHVFFFACGGPDLEFDGNQYTIKQVPITTWAGGSFLSDFQLII